MPLSLFSNESLFLWRMDQAIPLLKRLRCYSTDIKSMILKQGDIFFLNWKNLELNIRIQFFLTNFCCLFIYLFTARTPDKVILYSSWSLNNCSPMPAAVLYEPCPSASLTSYFLSRPVRNRTFCRKCFEVYANRHHHGHHLISHLPVELTRGNKLWQGLNLLSNSTRVNSYD